VSEKLKALAGTAKQTLAATAKQTEAETVKAKQKSGGEGEGKKYQGKS